jgi:sugar porter (SP) family MFS transporter
MQSTLTEAPAASGWYALFVSTVAATSGLLFGFDIAVINGALLFLRREFGLDEVGTQVAASALLAGCAAGASIAGVLSDRWGRRRVLLLCAVLFGLSAIGAALPRTPAEFAVARFAGGLAIGAASVLAPLYIAEVSPAAMRGRLVSLNQMAIVTGILLAYIVSWALSFLGPESWRWMFAAAALPSLFFFVALFFVPESPRWLSAAGRDTEALGVLRRTIGAERAPTVLAEIRAAIAEESGSLRELFAPGLRRALIIAAVLAVLQQVTGINTVLFYGSIIFEEQVGGMGSSATVGLNIVIGLINFLATIAALYGIDRLGRRPLLMVSAGVMAAAQLALGLAFLVHPPPAYLVLAIMGVCVASFAIGLGPGVWVVLSEIFPTRIRGSAMSIATVSLWLACILLTMTFLSLVKAITASGAFWLYGGLCAFTVLFVARMVPETKGLTLEQIERLWTRRAYPHAPGDPR